MTTTVPEALQPGDLLATHITGEVGKLIGFGELLNSNRLFHPFSVEAKKLSVFSHVAVVRDATTLIEAEVGGARIAPISEYLDGRPILFSTGLLGIDKATGLNIVKYAEAMVGAPYSSLDYFSIAAHRFHIPVPGLHDYIDDEGHIICSTLAAIAYSKAGKPLFPGQWTGYATPYGVAKLLVDKGAILV
jgi:hypothetical protein